MNEEQINQIADTLKAVSANKAMWLKQNFAIPVAELVEGQQYLVCKSSDYCLDWRDFSIWSATCKAVDIRPEDSTLRSMAVMTIRDGTHHLYDGTGDKTERAFAINIEKLEQYFEIVTRPHNYYGSYRTLNPKG